MNDLQSLQQDIEKRAVSWGEAIRVGDHRTANKENSAITKIAKKFKKDKNLGRSVLIPLLKHSNPAVRLLASVHALDQNLDVQESEEVLIKIANDPSIRVIRLMAQINLQKWNEKKDNATKQKDEPADF